MPDFTLIIGNKNISSWSLRGYLVLKHAGVDFEEILISLRPEQDRETLNNLTPAGKVPTVKHGNHYIWDSMAIAEYFNELYPDAKFWPADINARAHARSVSAEMHSGFAQLRRSMPMGCHNIFDKPEMTDDLKADIERVIDIWCEAREKYADGGPYLFGEYSFADMMFAPVVFRFKGYQIELPEILNEYCDTIINHPDIKSWLLDADPDDKA